MSEVVFYFYRFVFTPLAYLLLQIFSPFIGGKIREFVRRKNAAEFIFLGSADEPEIRAGRPFWIHAASGEIEYARPVLRELKARYPHVPIVVTYSSPSALRLLEKISEIDAWGPSPWEFDFANTKFLRRFEPRALLIARTDLWPVMMDVTAREGQPALLFAATFAAGSSRLRGLARLLTMRSLRRVDELQVVSTADAALLAPEAADLNLKICGDTRFDQVLYRLAHAQDLDSSFVPTKSRVFIAGSTWPEDEAVLFPAFARSKDWQFILAPHEVGEERLARIEGHLARLDLGSQRYSGGGPWQKQILLIDRVGLLAELYAWADLAFVGGSFRRQVHSVMEPLAAGLRVLVGPFHANNREALSFREEVVGGLPTVVVVQCTEDVVTALENPGLISGKEPVRELVRARTGATQSVLDWCGRKF